MSLPQFQPKEEDPILSEKERLAQVLDKIPLRIGIHSGKGGVGKTFLALQLALDMKNVGVIDADVDCPNIPNNIGKKEEMKVNESGKLEPINFKGIKIVSTGFMEPDEPIIIRGPIKHRLLTDFIERTNWGELEALIFDFPPGTSDVPLSAMQVANLTGVIIVTTPQKASIADAERSIKMAKKLGVNIYGVVENMSGEVFGEGEGEKLAKKNGVRFICTIPLQQEIREKAEEGNLALNQEQLEPIRKAIQGLSNSTSPLTKH